MSALVHALEARAPELSKRVLDQMYLDPFWMERFGARGRLKAEEDSRFHVAYLVQALLANDAGIMLSYTRWLQNLLVSRGMCSSHIDENFALLEQALADEVAQSEPARVLLREARAALRYEAGPARELQELAAQLVRDGVESLLEKQPSWQSRFQDGARAALAKDLAQHVDYLADAIAAGRLELFSNYVSWVGELLQRRAVPPEQLQQTLHWLADTLSHRDDVSPALLESTRHALALALQRLSQPAAIEPVSERRLGEPA